MPFCANTNLIFLQGGNVNAVDDKKMTPLHHAVQQKRLEMIKFLFEKGAKVDKEDDMGRCILHFSADSQDIECLELLVELLPKVNY